MDKAKRRGLAFMAIAVCLALISGFFFFNYTKELEREIGERLDVVIAKQFIPARTMITVDMLDMRSIPKRYAQESYVQRIEDVLPDFVTLVNIEEGDILQRNAVDRNAGLEPGMRAVSIGVNRVQSVGGSIRPGNRVDVIVSYTEGGVMEGQAKTVLLFQDVMVLGVSVLSPGGGPVTGTAEEAAAASPARFSPTGELLSEATVTLALSPEDAMKLTYMDNFGEEVRFVIRRLDEKEVPPAPSITSDIFK